MAPAARICANCQHSVLKREGSLWRRCLFSYLDLSPTTLSCALFAPVQDRKAVTARELDEQAALKLVAPAPR